MSDLESLAFGYSCHTVFLLDSLCDSIPIIPASVLQVFPEQFRPPFSVFISSEIVRRFEAEAITRSQTTDETQRFANVFPCRSTRQTATHPAPRVKNNVASSAWLRKAPYDFRLLRLKAGRPFPSYALGIPYACSIPIAIDVGLLRHTNSDIRPVFLRETLAQIQHIDMMLQNYMNIHMFAASHALLPFGATKCTASLFHGPGHASRSYSGRAPR